MLGLILLTGACGTSPSANQGCSDLANARCARENACSANALVNHFGDLASCQMRETAACLDRLQASGTSSTPAFEEGCSVALPLESCPDFFDNNAPIACTPAPGEILDGAPCLANAQCASGNCNLGPHVVCGTCGTPAGIGESCDGRSCMRELICQGDPPVCVQPQPLGGPCDKNTPCAIGGSCVGAMPGQLGNCQAAVTTQGAPCDPTRALTPGCERAKQLYCNATTQTCEPIVYASAGQPCGDVNGATVDCADAGGCYPTTAKTGTCLAAAAEGAACDTVNGPGCRSPAKCVTAAGTTGGNCQLPDATTCR
jgi:hypothetical protein